MDEWNVPLTRRERGVDEKESQRGLGGGGRLSVIGGVASGAAELQPGFGSGSGSGHRSSSGHRFDESAVRGMCWKMKDLVREIIDVLFSFIHNKLLSLNFVLTLLRII